MLTRRGVKLDFSSFITSPIIGALTALFGRRVCLDIAPQQRRW